MYPKRNTWCRNIIDSEYVYIFWLHVRLRIHFFNNELYQKRIPIPAHRRTPKNDEEDSGHKP